MLTALLPANALGLFAPVFTIVLYAALAATRGDVMDAETAFTTIALLLMITRMSRAHVVYAEFPFHFSRHTFTTISVERTDPITGQTQRT